MRHVLSDADLITSRDIALKLEGTMTTIPVMRRDCYDTDNDGIIDRSHGVFATIIAGVGGINAYQVVFIDPAAGCAFPADGTNQSHAGKVCGIAPEAIAEDEYGLVMHSGEIENPAWDLDPGEMYFLTTGGELTKTPPASGFAQKIGLAIDSVTLLIELGVPVLR